MDMKKHNLKERERVIVRIIEIERERIYTVKNNSFRFAF